MSLSQVAKKFEKLLTDNSPVLLTSVGVAGTIATAVLTGKASFEAAKIINETERMRDIYSAYPPEPLEPKEKVELVWKLYIPPVVVGAGTVSAIVLANRIGTRRAAAMAAAYTISEKAYTEYREKVVEKLGEAKEQEVRDEIAQQRVNANPPNSEVIIVDNGDVLFLESYTGRYFKSSMETVKKALNDTNYQMYSDMYASLGDFQQRVGLPRTSLSEEVGWTVEDKIDIEFSATLTEDQRPCIVMNYIVAPVREYHRFR